MKCLTCTRATMPEGLQQSTFNDRRQQFIQRLSWDLCVTPNGYEIDEYDDAFSTYLMVHRNERHLGSCRVRPTTASTMLEDHFRHNFPDARAFLEMQRGHVFELTRFCRSPGITVRESRLMLHHLAVLLDEFRDQNGLSGFVAVVFPHVSRFLDTIGVRYLVLSQSEISGRQAYLICITHAQRVGTGSNDALGISTPQSMAA